MLVELLFWAGCPSHETALRELRSTLAQEGLDADAVLVREIETDADAAGERFVGSPTIRIDSVDVQPEPNEPVGLTCRVYRRRDGRISPTPDPEDVREAIRRARTHARAHARAAHAESESTRTPAESEATRAPAASAAAGRRTR
jgi:hypothetical protein